MTDRRAGFTLIELLITVVLLSVGILAVIGTVTSMRRFQTLNQTIAEMSDLAQSQLEQLRALQLASDGLNEKVRPDQGNTQGGSISAPCSTTGRFTAVRPGASGRSYCLGWVVRESGTLPEGTRLIQMRVDPIGSTRGPVHRISTYFYVPPPVR